MRRFNVTGLCVPEEDYMVDISGKIEQIRKLVDGINEAGRKRIAA